MHLMGEVRGIFSTFSVSFSSLSLFPDQSVSAAREREPSPE